MSRSEPSGLQILLKTIPARAYPRVVGFARERTWVFFDIMFPLVGTFTMVFVYQGLHAPKAYIGFAIMGGAMLAFWQNVLWSMAMQFSWDRDNGTLELYAVAPTSFEAVLLGMAAGAMLSTSARALIIIALGTLAFGVSFSAAGLAPAVGIFLLTLAGLYCLGMLLASLFLFYTREAWHLSEALQEPVYFLSGLYFPVKALPAYVAGGASLLPLTLGLDAMRQLLLPAGLPVFIPVGVEALLVALQIPLYGAAAYVALRRMEALARRDGKLTSRWS